MPCFYSRTLDRVPRSATSLSLYILVRTVLFLFILLVRVSAEDPDSTTFPPVLGPSFSSPPPNVTKKSRQDEVDILPPHYYRDVAPTVDDKPVRVTVSVVILNMKISSGSAQTFDVDIFYHNYWSDHRLQKPTNEDAIAQRINLSPQESLPQYKLSDAWRKRLWIPDTYFRNAIDGSVSNILTPTYYFTITNYTEVFMAVRLNLKLSCEMNFYKFPFDTQTCFINLTTTSEDISTVILEWEMFRVGSHVDVSEFTIVSIDKNSCVKHLDIGVYPCLYAEIVFRRNIGNYMIKRFIPSFIIVIMTFLGFWIPTSVSPARTSLPITALLALITQQIQSDLNVSYVYALQVWNIVCIIFVFANLLEFAIALYVMHMAQKCNTKKTDPEILNNLRLSEPKIESTLSPPNERKMVPNSRKKANSLRYYFRTTSRHSGVDHISRFLFPFSYALFVIVFATYCIYY